MLTEHDQFLYLYSYPMESKEVPMAVLQLETQSSRTSLLRSAINTTAPQDVIVLPAPVDTTIFASNIINLDTAKKTAVSKLDALYGMTLKYLHYNVLSEGDAGGDSDEKGVVLKTCLADWTEYAMPLPGVPASEFKNIDAMKTIKE